MDKRNACRPRRTIDVLGIETKYYVAGKENGRPLLLLHGMGASGDAYRELMAALAGEHYLIAPDLPGFGCSAMIEPYSLNRLVEWVAAFHDALNLPPCPVVGHSFGGVLATHFSLTHPQNIERLVLIAPALLAMQNVPLFLIKASFSLGLLHLGMNISQSPAILPFSIRRPFYDTAKQPHSVWERRADDYKNARASAEAIKLLAEQRARQNLEKATLPICMIWGENDPVVPVRNGDELVDIFPNAALTQLAECGHVPMLEKTAVVIQTIRAFLV